MYGIGRRGEGDGGKIVWGLSVAQPFKVGIK